MGGIGNTIGLQRPKGAKDEVKTPEGPTSRRQALEGPLDSGLRYEIFVSP